MTVNINHLILAPILALCLFAYMQLNGVGYLPTITACITLITAWWWATEALPVPATSLVPFAAFPLFGVLTHRESAAGLGSHIILLLLGGFIMAKALEKTGAHERFAMAILHIVGQRVIRS